MGLKYGTKLTHGHKLGSGSGYSPRWVTLFCIVSFCLGVIFINRFGISPVQIETDEASSSLGKSDVDCDDKDASVEAGDVFSQVSHTHDIIMTLDKTISSLEMQLASARSAKKPVSEASNERRKLFFVMGIMTAFSSRKRRDSIRETWMPQGKDLLRLEKEKGILIRFVIGHSHIKQNEKLWSTGEHVIRVESSLSGCLGLLISYCVSASKISSATSDGLLDNAIDVEDKQHQDFLRLNHVEGYHELSSKTQIYFSTVVAKWDADFYIKVDDDVHINLGMIGSTLNRHRLKPRVYIGCMKSGPVLAQKGVKYHEPEYWKFGEDGNKYFRHATGQIYAISRDLATYISVNRHMLHKYANEDVSLGSWFIGLDVEHIDDRSLCCQTPPDCEWKTQAGNMCAASFDWSCSGICKSVERMKDVHRLCGEGDEAIWHTSF